MKKSVMKKMMAGLCAAVMLTTCSMGVFAEETNVVEETNIDKIVIWQSPSGELYQTASGSMCRRICSSLAEYITGEY